MPNWKLDIFKRAVIIRFNTGEGTVEDIVKTYPKLTEVEQQEIVTAVKGEIKLEEVY